MRAGIRFHDGRCIAVIADAHGKVIAEYSQPFDPDDGIDEVFGWLARRAAASLVSATLDVSELLKLERKGRIVAIRISPRPAVDQIHELGVSAELEGSVHHTLHITGGHDMRGRQLMDLNLQTLAAELKATDRGGGLVASVTAVGSVANPDHEERAADVILAHFPRARVSLSHAFFSTSLGDRDFTSTVNAALLAPGERLAKRVERAAERHLPAVPIFVGLNDGGRAPIRSLGATPVHASRSATALRTQGARHFAEVNEGDVVIIDDDTITVSHVHRGVPAAQTVVKRGRGPRLASNSVRIDRHVPIFRSDLLAAAAVVDIRSPDTPLAPYAPEPTVGTDVDLIALGAAVAPLSSWADFLGPASTAAQVTSGLRSTEEDLRAQTIHWGAAPDSTRVVESTAYSLAYGSRNVVRIRVHVIGDWIDVGPVESRQV